MARAGAWVRRVLGIGRGRPLAALLLVIAALPLAFPEVSPLTRARIAWFDTYQSRLPRARHTAPVVIVAIDERALRTFGQWPWPRDRLARLLERIAADRPLVIGLDAIFPEPDQTSPEALAARLDPAAGELRRLLEALPANDAVLAAQLRRFPSVLAAAGFDFATPATVSGIRSWPITINGADDPLSRVRRYPHVLASLPELQTAAAGHGLLSVDLDRGVLRRIPLVSAIGETLVPALSLELLRVGIGADRIEIETGPDGIRAIRIGDLRVPTQPAGDVWLHFSRPAAQRYVSAADLLAGTLARGTLDGHLVIVALTGLGLVDFKTNALGDYLPGVDAHAQLIESFVDGRFLLRPGWMPWLELALLCAGGVLLICCLPWLRLWIGALLSLSVSIGILGLGFALFHWNGWLMDAISVFTGLNTVFAALVVGAYAHADHERRMAQRALQSARESAARVAGELAAARRIQMGILPRTEGAFPNETRFELAAMVEPARSVGGDLYDFCMLDRDHLFVLIADVSGKGIPASLFMSITKVLARSIVLRETRALGAVLTQANVEIARANTESLFVTAFAGLLNVSTGLLRYWTAGHDLPYLRRAGGTEQLDGSEAGPPLCVLDDYTYPEQQARLRPGETLVLYTDGVTEAAAADGALYGKARLARRIDSLPAASSAAATLEAIRADVSDFVAGAEPSDDLTLLVLHWRGSGAALNAP